MVANSATFEAFISPLIGGIYGGLLLAGDRWAILDRADALSDVLPAGCVRAYLCIVRAYWNRAPFQVNTLTPGPITPAVLAALEPADIALAIERRPDGTMCWTTCTPTLPGPDVVTPQQPEVDEDDHQEEDNEDHRGPTLPRTVIQTLRQLSKLPSAAAIYVGLVSMSASAEPAALDTLIRWTRRSRSSIVRGIAQLIRLEAVRREPRPGHRTEFRLTEGQWWAGSLLRQRKVGGRR